MAFHELTTKHDILGAISLMFAHSPPTLTHQIPGSYILNASDVASAHIRLVALYDKLLQIFLASLTLFIVCPFGSYLFLSSANPCMYPLSLCFHHTLYHLHHPPTVL